MTTNYSNQIITSLEGLESSILTDKYVYHWFKFLISQPEFLRVNNIASKFKSHYEMIRRINLFMLCVIFSFFLTLIAMLMKKMWLFLVLAGFLLVLFYKLEKSKKKIVAEISMFYISQGYTGEVLSQTTLYQMSEDFSLKFKIPSLVDCIYHLDKRYRFLIIFLYLLIFDIVCVQIYWVGDILFVLFYWAAFLVLNTTFFYKYFK